MSDICLVCSGIRIEPLYEGVLKCQECGFVFSAQNLTDEELFRLYSKNYFFGNEYIDYIADKEVFQKNFKLRLKVLQKFLSPPRHKHFFEIGSAYGFFLDLVKDRFDSAQGIDITEDGVNYARKQLNLDVIHADFLKYDFDNKKFDVVCMWDTIEHLCRPDLYIKKVGEHMESGALLAVTTGDIESLNARMKKEKWRLMHPPTHVSYFSKNTLAKMLDNYGFDIIYNNYCGFYRSLDNCVYNLAAYKKDAFLYKVFSKSNLASFNFYLNLYDIMYVIARKR